MTIATQDRALSADEWCIVCALREIPSGALRDALVEVLDAMVERVREPRCVEYQADGVSCAALHTACEQCQAIGGLLGELKVRLQPRLITADGA